VDEYMSEKEQWESLKDWLRVNGLWIVAGVALGAGALWGYRFWQERKERLALEASTRYEQVMEALSRNDRTRGLTLIEELRRDHSGSGYADQAELLAARLYVDTGEFEKAAERLEQVMNASDDAELRLVARGRLARIRIQQGNFDAALALLDISKAGAFAARFNEMRGDAYVAKGEVTQAVEAYRAAHGAGTAAGIDTALLDLKINELSPGAVAAAAPPPKAE